MRRYKLSSSPGTQEGVERLGEGGEISQRSREAEGRRALDLIMSVGKEEEHLPCA